MNVVMKFAKQLASPAVLQACGLRRVSAHAPRLPYNIAALFSSSSQDAAQQADADENDELYRMVELEVRGHDAAVLKSYEWFVTTTARELDIKIGKCWALRKPHFNRMTLLKSVHIYKKHRVQYEIRTHYRFMQLEQLTGSTADTFLEYVERNLPEGVGLKVTRVQVLPLPAHLVPPTPTPAPSGDLPAP